MILKIPLLFEISFAEGKTIDHELLREALMLYFETMKDDFTVVKDGTVNPSLIKISGIPTELMLGISKIRMISRTEALKLMK
jgi:hypothetical protein